MASNPTPIYCDRCWARLDAPEHDARRCTPTRAQRREDATRALLREAADALDTNHGTDPCSDPTCNLPDLIRRLREAAK